MADVFISYSRADEQFANRLRDRLAAKGVSVYFDRAIVAGEDFSNGIHRALDEAKVVVVLLSQNSARSGWVDAELRMALESQAKIVPVLIGPNSTENWVW